MKRAVRVDLDLKDGIFDRAVWDALEKEWGRQITVALNGGNNVDVHLPDGYGVDGVDNGYGKHIRLTKCVKVVGLRQVQTWAIGGGRTREERYENNESRITFEIRPDDDTQRVSMAKTGESVVRFRLTAKTQRETMSTYGFTGSILTEARLEVSGRGDIADPSCKGLETKISGKVFTFLNGQKKPSRPASFKVVDGKLLDSKNKPVKVINVQEVLEGLGLAIPETADIAE